MDSFMSTALGVVIGLVGVLLTYAFYKLAISSRKLFIGLGGLLLLCGFVLYSIPGKSSDFSCCPCVANTGATAGCDTNTTMSKACGVAIQSLSLVNKSLSSFFPSRGGYDDGTISKPCKRLLWYELFYWGFHFLAILYMVSIFAAVFGVELINRIIVWGKCIPWPHLCIRFSRTFRPNAINVFWDVCEESRMMCENAMAAKSAVITKKSIVFVLPESSHSWLRLKDDDSVVQSLVRKGFTWIIGSVEEPGTLVAASRHFFLGSNGHKNLSQAEILLRRLEKDIAILRCSRAPKGCSGNSQITVYVRAWAEADDDFMYKWADEWNGRLAKSDVGIAVEIVREEAIVSRKFLIDHPMLDCPGIQIDTVDSTVSGEFRLLVIGFGVQGERLMCDMVCDAQFLKKSDAGKSKSVPNDPVSITVDVIDSNSASFGWFKENCRDACSRYRIHFTRMDARQAIFWQWLDRQAVYNRIVICTQDDVVNLELANDVANYYCTHRGVDRNELRETIFVRTRNKMLADAVKLTRIDKSYMYQMFGNLMDTYSEKTLLVDRWNDGAIFVNGVWSARYEEGGESNPIVWYKTHGGMSYGRNRWRSTSTFDRESSRASLLHQRNLLRLMGYRIDNGETGAATPATQEMITQVKATMLNGSRLQMLSESEHMRWMAFHFVRGWKTWKPTQEELEKLATKKQVEPSSIKKLVKKHAALVDFAKLDEVDGKFNIVNKKNGQKNVNSKKKDDDLVYGVEAIFDAGFTVTLRTGDKQ